MQIILLFYIILSSDITKSFEKKVEDSIKRWEDLQVLDKKWTSYIKPSNSKPGTMYGLIKTHKENNPARVITSDISSRKIITKDSILVSFDVVNMFQIVKCFRFRGYF